MKYIKYSALLLAMILILCACSETPVSTASSEPDLLTYIETDMDTQMAAAAQAAEKASKEKVEYTIEKEDRSIKNENGQVLLRHFYERVVLKETTQATANINLSIASDMSYFMESDNPYASSVAGLEELITVSEAQYGDFKNTASAKVTHNADGILSIRIYTDWYMGGVRNEAYYGLNYNIETGKSMIVTDFVDEKPENLKNTFDSMTERYLKGEYAEADTSILEDFKIDDYTFYIENGEIILSYPPYTFIGNTVITVPTGIMIKQT